MLTWFEKFLQWFYFLKRREQPNPNVLELVEHALGDRSVDDCLWYKDTREHAFGQVSTARVNLNNDNNLQIGIGSQATFVGVYDGHSGSAATEYVNAHLFDHLSKLAREHGGISEDIIRQAIQATEAGFLDHVRGGLASPSAGTCCLVGVFWNRQLFLANLGDSRLVTAILSHTSTGLRAIQLTKDHSVNVANIRDELSWLHLETPFLIAERDGIWRINDTLQITRSIGDFQLKHPEFGSVKRSVIRDDPELSTAEIIRESFKYFVFGSRELWRWLSNEEVIEIVRQQPEKGIARRLAVTAMTKAAIAGGTSYTDLKTSSVDRRRMYHNDITIIVINVNGIFNPNDVSSTTKMQTHNKLFKAVKDFEF